MGKLEQVRENLRRAYETGMDSVRTARADARAADAEDEAPIPTRPVILTPPSVNQRDDLGVPRPLRIAGAWAWRILLLIILGFGVLWSLGQIQLVVVPIVIATLLSALLSPLVGTLRRAGLPRSLAAATVLIGGLAAVGGTLYLVVSRFIEGAPQLGANLSVAFNRIQEWTQRGPLHLSKQELDSLGHEISGWFTTHRDTLTDARVDRAGSLILTSSGMHGSEEVIRMARELNPDIRVLARSAYLRELDALRRAGAETAIAGEGEVALALTEALLRRLGATPEQIDRERERVRGELFGHVNRDDPAAPAVSGPRPPDPSHREQRTTGE